jgi:uncharacterized SAM-dependent methyltransferase
MEENKAIDSKNIQFEYADNVASNVNREQSMVNDLNQWLGQYAGAINDQTGIIIVYFQNNRNQRVSFDGMTDDFQAILDKQLRKFQPLG